MNKKVVALIIFTAVVVIFLFLTLISLINRSKQMGTDQPVSTPISYGNDALPPAVTYNSVEILQPTVANTVIPFNLNYNAEFNLVKVNNFSFKVNSEMFDIYLTAPAEAFGGIFEGETTAVKGEKYFRETMNEMYNFQSLMTQQNINRGLYYFYADDYRTNDECNSLIPKPNYCGNYSIILTSTTKPDSKLQLLVHCAVDNANSASECDEFVNSLSITDSTSLVYNDPKFSFVYPSNLEVTKFTPPNPGLIVEYKGSKLLIEPEVRGMGYEDENPIVTESAIVVNGESLTKFRNYFQGRNFINYLVSLKYSNYQALGYILIANYGFENQVEDPEVIQTFDKIISSFVIR